MRLLILIFGLAVAGVTGPAVAGPWEDAGEAYKKGDYETAVRLWRPLAEQGSIDAQYQLGLAYRKGEGVPRDYAQMAAWFRKAAEQGYAPAQTDLGSDYTFGIGVPQDYVQAAAWFRRAAEQGYAEAQENLGLAYRKGEGVPQDYVQAVFWFRKAAEQGDDGAQDNLGDLYRKGEGVPRDYASALFWYRKSAEQGYAPSQDNLGVMYQYGIGVPQDYVQAAAWFRRAAEQGYPNAQSNLQKLLDTASTKALPPLSITPQRSALGSLIQMRKEGGTYVVPVRVNGAITLDFTVDSGASDVTIPEDVVSTLMRMGTVRDDDFIGEQVYVLADGSKVKSHRFRIRSLQVGDRVLENVTGSVASRNGSLLLGQSFLGRFKSWSIDNSRHALVLE